MVPVDWPGLSDCMSADWCDDRFRDSYVITNLKSPVVFFIQPRLNAPYINNSCMTTVITLDTFQLI
jgi:hypothetical protein